MELQIIKVANDVDSKNVTKFVGAYITKEQDEQLTLLSISEGVSKSTLFRGMLVSKLNSQDLIKGTAKRLYNLWQMKAQRWSDFDLKTFRVMIDIELCKKRLRKALVDQIFEEFDKLTK